MQSISLLLINKEVEEVEEIKLASFRYKNDELLLALNLFDWRTVGDDIDWSEGLNK